jgi:hypothetical protein
MGRLIEMERLLGKALLGGTRKERRRPLTKLEISAEIVGGILDWLYDVRDPDYAPTAHRIAREIEAMPTLAVGEEVLAVARELLSETPGGEKVFKFLKNRAPHCLGWGYAQLKLYNKRQWVIEDWHSDYEYYRKEL